MGKLKLHPKLMPKLPLMPTMDTTAVDTDTVTDTDMDTSDTDMVDTTAVDTTAVDTDTTTARGPLMPNPRLMLMLPLMPTMDTTAVDTVMAMDTDTVDTMVDTVDTMAADTDMAVTDISVKLLLNCKFFKPYFLSYN